MIQRDFVLRQIQQLVQVLTRVLKLKHEGLGEDVFSVVDTALQDTLGMGVKDITDLPGPDVVALCKENGQLHAQKALVVAELIEATFDEDAIGQTVLVGRMQSVLALYEALVNSGEAVPFDIYDRIAHLKEGLNHEG